MSLFTPYRTVGYTTTSCSPSLQKSGTQSFLTTSIGNQFQVLETEKLTPAIVSTPVDLKDNESGISMISTTSKLTFVAISNRVIMFKRAKSVCEHDCDGRVVQILVLGDTLIVLSEEGSSPSLSSDDDMSDSSSSDEESDSDPNIFRSKSKLSIFSIKNASSSASNSNCLHLVKTIPLDFLATSLEHPDTYLNKILIGSRSGNLFLYNIRSSKMVHKFSSHIKSTTSHSSITVITQSPVLDVVAIGNARGDVTFINLKKDKKIFSFSHDRTRINTLSFSTSLSSSSSTIAVGCDDGNVYVWDLEDRKLSTTITNCHQGPIISTSYIKNEPLLITTGYDNSIKMWIFDSPDGTARLLKSREGHSKPPTTIRYQFNNSNGDNVLATNDSTDAKTCNILSVSSDRTLRLFSTVRSGLDTEYSQGKGLHKRAKAMQLEKESILLPPIKAFASAESRSRDWGSIVTIHANHANAYVWDSERKAQSGPVLRQLDWPISLMKKPTHWSTHATSVGITACGNFALIGTRGGVIYKYNIQSGMQRGTFPKELTNIQETLKLHKPSSLPGSVKTTLKKIQPDAHVSANELKAGKRTASLAEESRVAELKRKERRHYSDVVGVGVDNLNKYVVSVCAEGKINTWSLRTHTPHQKSPFILPDHAVKFLYMRLNNFVAIALSDHSIVIYDVVNFLIVRRLGGDVESRHTKAINDLVASKDCRRIFSSSLDGSIRIYDLPTGRCVNWLSFNNVPTSITLSPTGEFLATSHRGKKGLKIWSDKSFFSPVFFDGVPTKPINLDREGVINEFKIDEHEDNDKGTEVQAEDDQNRRGSNSDDDGGNAAGDEIVPKEEGLLTLSGLPSSHWKTLFHLELIKQRNKPTEAPKKPEAAPFFLQQRGVKDMFFGDGNEKEGLEGGQSVGQQAEGKKSKIDMTGWGDEWSDDENDDEQMEEEDGNVRVEDEDQEEETGPNRKRAKTTSSKILKNQKKDTKLDLSAPKSKFAAMLNDYNDGEASQEDVTKFLGTLSPSQVSLGFQTLCDGDYDHIGIYRLILCCRWLCEATESGLRFEAVNAYIARFLEVHSITILRVCRKGEGEDGEAEERRTQLGEGIKRLTRAQRLSAERLKAKMQQTVCIIQHVNNIVL